MVVGSLIVLGLVAMAGLIYYHSSSYSDDNNRDITYSSNIRYNEDDQWREEHYNNINNYDLDIGSNYVHDNNVPQHFEETVSQSILEEAEKVKIYKPAGTTMKETTMRDVGNDIYSTSTPTLPPTTAPPPSTTTLPPTTAPLLTTTPTPTTTPHATTTVKIKSTRKNTKGYYAYSLNDALDPDNAEPPDFKSVQENKLLTITIQDQEDPKSDLYKTKYFPEQHFQENTMLVANKATLCTFSALRIFVLTVVGMMVFIIN